MRLGRYITRGLSEDSWLMSPIGEDRADSIGHEQNRVRNGSIQLTNFRNPACSVIYSSSSRSVDNTPTVDYGGFGRIGLELGSLKGRVRGENSDNWKQNERHTDSL